jgi:hypothetical protein
MNRGAVRTIASTDTAGKKTAGVTEANPVTPAA